MLLTELPPGWERKRLGKICQINPRRGPNNPSDNVPVTFVPMSAVDELAGAICCPQIKLYKEVKRGYTAFIEGDVLFAKITPSMENGKAAVARNLSNGLGFASTEFHILRPLDGVIPEWIFFFIRQNTFRNQAASNFTGTVGQQRVPEGFLTDSLIPVPSLDQQRGIVSRIREMLDRIVKAHKVRHDSLSLAERIATLEELAIWPESSLQNAKTLEEVTSFLARGHQSKQGPSDHYLIKTQHVQTDKYIDTQITLASQVAAKVKPEAFVQPGDVLIACSAAGCLGRVASYRLSGKKASTDTHVAIARANPQLILPAYLYAYLRGAQGQLQIRSRERGDWQREKIGFRFTELNLADLRQVPVPTPSLSDQRRIVVYVEALNARIRDISQRQEETLTEFESLSQAILARAFSGKL